MALVSAIQADDAKRLKPPAAHRAGMFLRETGDLVADLGDLQQNLTACLESRPHDKAEILCLVDSFKKRAMALHGQAVLASQSIKDGR
ncbi:hypothetical protein [Labrenzia sp. OB1]|uniref:hypothetical protein n=1 Tax=Labrenzia sp. OB1 TaxID=1561204 RepID=UPI0007B18E51|nr:hypothetical protein [Labrenzia sp. OB1]KZM48269.1 hypothetical protein OA90_21160 [Labrenzia sp. OB1]